MLGYFETAPCIFADRSCFKEADIWLKSDWNKIIEPGQEEDDNDE